MGNMEPYVRVNRSHPCPICGRPDWCSYNSTGVVCMRTPSAHEMRNGGWLHLRDMLSEYAGRTEETMQTPQPAAPLAERNRAYRALLRCLTLSDAHRQQLLARGMSLHEIRRGGYRTLPIEGRAEISRRLIDHGVDLRGVPGFMQKEGRYGAYWTLAGSPGLLIPVLDAGGKVQGLQIRVDDPGDGARYRWLSSAGKPGGAGATTWLHVARGDPRKPVWITEGPLKANIAAYRLQATVIAVPGVSNWKGVPELVRGRDVVVAYDADVVTKHEVKYHERILVSALLKAGCRVRIARWPMEKGKGLDDLLVAGGSVLYLEPKKRKAG